MVNFHTILTVELDINIQFFSSYCHTLSMVEFCQSFKKRGTCKFGNTCRFLHEGYRKNCFYYSTTGGCKFGDNCRDLHHELLFDEPHKNVCSICTYFSTPDGCKFGDSCRNRHLLNANSVGESTTENFVENIEIKTKGCALRIVHTSDTHNYLSAKSSFHIPRGDVLVHTGDFTNRGTQSEFKTFNAWLEKFKSKFPIRIVLFGNHDLKSEKGNLLLLKSWLPAATHVLCFESLQINGINFYGSPWLYYQDGLYRNRGETSPTHRFNEIPANTHIVLTHGPARNLHDHLHLETRMGSEDLLDALARVDAAVHLCGHIHESYGHTILRARPYRTHADDILIAPKPAGQQTQGSSSLHKLWASFCCCLSIDRLLCDSPNSMIQQRRYLSMNSAACGQTKTEGLVNPAQVVDVWLDRDGKAAFKVIDPLTEEAIQKQSMNSTLQWEYKRQLIVMAVSGIVVVAAVVCFGCSALHCLG